MDVYDLFDHIFEEILDDIFQPDNIKNDWANAFIEIFQYATNNKKAILHIYNSVKREQLERYLLAVFD